MEGLLFDHIQYLEKSRTNWRLKVRVTRMWSTFSPETGSVKGHNLILLDDDNSHVHAYVYPDTWNVIGNGVVEGNVYTVENFQVRDTIGRLKPVSTNFCIHFLGSTIITAVENDVMIPAHKFELMDLGDLLTECNKYINDDIPEFAIDVVGVVEGFEKAKQISTKFGERDIVRFKLTDGMEIHKVSVWGDLANTVNEDYYNVTEKPIIAVVTSTKLTLFRNQVQIATLPSSKVYLNLDWEAVNELRQRLEEEGYKPDEGSSEMINVQPINASVEKVTLKELSDNIRAYSATKAAIVTFTVIKVEDEDNWWYNICNNCHNEVEKIEKKFRCVVCKRNFPFSEKRFRLFIMADDNTFACNVILMDRVVKRIVRTTATNLLNESKKVALNNSMSAALKDIVGKEIKVRLSLTEANINGDSNVFEAVDLYDISLMENVINYSPISKCPSFNQSETREGIELFDTPGSSSSVAKKIKKEP